MSAVTFSGPGATGIVSPAQSKVALSSAYLDIRSDGWVKQYLPELYEAEVERYGDRSISGFLSMVGAEMPMASDQVIWSEQGRLHLAYSGSVNVATGAVSSIVDIDSGASVTHALRTKQTVVCQVEGTSSPVVCKAMVTNDGATPVLRPYGGAHFANISGIASTGAKAIKFFVYGSDFAKGDNGLGGGIEATFKSFTNKPIIIKDEFMISGSDASQIGWVEVSGEAGQSGYLWYLKSEGDTRKRFEDYLEMTMVEAVDKDSNSAVTGTGSEGLFQALENRGLIASSGMFDYSGSGANDDLNDFDILLQELDKQGGISENMMFLNREAALAVDDLLASVNAHTAGTTNYGVFNNSEDMALNLGFSGFRRASYDFYKTDWKYLNNKSTRFLVNDGAGNGKVEGVMVPAGTTTVYDENMGKNIRRPFLHVRYRASQADDRKLKTWTTGSVGAATTDLDAMKVHYLSERCLITQGANNFVLFR
jgi:hypothetical protein